MVWSQEPYYQRRLTLKNGRYCLTFPAPAGPITMTPNFDIVACECQRSAALEVTKNVFMIVYLRLTPLRTIFFLT